MLLFHREFVLNAELGLQDLLAASALLEKRLEKLPQLRRSGPIEAHQYEKVLPLRIRKIKESRSRFRLLEREVIPIGENVGLLRPDCDPGIIVSRPRNYWALPPS